MVARTPSCMRFAPEVIVRRVAGTCSVCPGFGLRRVCAPLFGFDLGADGSSALAPVTSSGELAFAITWTGISVVAAFKVAYWMPEPLRAAVWNVAGANALRSGFDPTDAPSLAALAPFVDLVGFTVFAGARSSSAWR